MVSIDEAAVTLEDSVGFDRSYMYGVLELWLQAAIRFMHTSGIRQEQWRELCTKLQRHYSEKENEIEPPESYWDAVANSAHLRMYDGVRNHLVHVLADPESYDIYSRCEKALVLFSEIPVPAKYANQLTFLS